MVPSVFHGIEAFSTLIAVVNNVSLDRFYHRRLTIRAHRIYSLAMPLACVIVSDARIVRLQYLVTAYVGSERYMYS